MWGLGPGTRGSLPTLASGALCSLAEQYWRVREAGRWEQGIREMHRDQRPGRKKDGETGKRGQVKTQNVKNKTTGPKWSRLC